MADFITSSVKKPREERDFTEEEEKEFMKCALNMTYWMKKYLYVQSEKTGRTLFAPRPYQQRMIDAMANNNFSILLSSRQSGKSTCVVAYLLHSAIFNADEKIGITSYKRTNCIDLMNRIKFAYENLPHWMKPAVTEYNKFSVSFTNDSRIYSMVTSENTFRGHSLTKCFIDEMAFIKETIVQEFWAGLLPSVMAEGEEATTKVMIVSTPNGTGNLFSKHWHDAKQGLNGFAHVEVKYEEIPGRTEKFEKAMLKKMSRNKWLAEYKNQFISDKGTLINSLVLEKLPFMEPVEIVGDDLWLFKKDFKGKTLAMAVDVGEGVGKDYHVVQILDVNTLEQVAEYRNNFLTQTEFTKEIMKIMKLMFDLGCKDLYYTVENNGVGAGVINLLYNATNSALDRAHFISDPEGNKLGIAMTRSSKPNGCATLKDLVEGNKIKLNSERLITELKFFVKSGNSYKAESGLNDDLVMGMVIMMLLMKNVADFEEGTYETFNEIDFDIENDGYEVGIFF